MRYAAVALALLMLFAGFVPAAVAGTTTGTGDRPADSAASLGDAPRPVAQADAPALSDPATDIVIALQRDTDAEWTIEFRYPLETENQTRVFREFARQYETGEASVGLDVSVFERFASRAEEATGRQMAVTNATRSWAVENETGVLRLSFVWTNFLERPSGDTLVLRDAFRTPGNGTWLTSLDDGQTLVVRTPPEYTINSTSRLVDRISRNSVVIQGPQTFGPDDRLVVQYQAAVNGDGDGDAVPWTLVAAVIVAAAIVLAGFFVFFRGRGDAEPSPDAGVGEPGSGGAATEAGAAERDEEPETPDEDVDLSLLSDEERVEYILDQRGGRMRQADIVKETGWSDAKVSQLLSTMADEGRVNKLRLGRENLISLPDDGEGGNGSNGGDGPDDGDGSADRNGNDRR